MTPSTRKSSTITYPYINKSVKTHVPPVLARIRKLCANKAFVDLESSNLFSGGCRSASRTERNEQSADPRAHHTDRGGRATIAGDDPLLHRSRPRQRRGARDPEDGPRGGRLEPPVHRRARGAGRGPYRRGRRGLPLHPARDEPGANPDRRGSGRSRPRRPVREG